jgi:hypothetical protein
VGNCTITDRGNSTGVNVVISELSGTGTLYVSGFAPNIATRAFTVARTFNANGTYTVSLQNGAYFAIFVDGSGQNIPISFRASDGGVGLHEQCLIAIRDFVLSLSLPAVPTDPTKHKLHKRPVRSRAEFGTPLFGVHYWKKDETRRPVDNCRDEVVYPVEMVLMSANDGENRSDGDWTLLREIIGRTFPRCPLEAVPEVHTVTVVPGPLYGTLDSAADVDVQLITFRCFTEQLSLIE